MGACPAWESSQAVALSPVWGLRAVIDFLVGSNENLEQQENERRRFGKNDKSA